MFTIAYYIRRLGRLIRKFGDLIDTLGFWLDPELRQERWGKKEEDETCQQ